MVCVTQASVRTGKCTRPHEIIEGPTWQNSGNSRPRGTQELPISNKIKQQHCWLPQHAASIEIEDRSSTQVRTLEAHHDGGELPAAFSTWQGASQPAPKHKNEPYTHRKRDRGMDYKGDASGLSRSTSCHFASSRRASTQLLAATCGVWREGVARRCVCWLRGLPPWDPLKTQSRAESLR